MSKSTLRHVVKRRVHLERAQPTNRRALGLLEKKSDYKIRAAAYHRKEEEIKNLAEKARNRNKEEFNYKMVKTAIKKKDGTITMKRESIDDNSVLKIHDALDYNVLAAKKQSEAKRVSNLEGDMPLTAINRQGQRTLFVDEDDVALLNKKANKKAAKSGDRVEEPTSGKKRSLPKNLGVEDVAALLDTEVAILDGSVGLGLSKKALREQDLSSILRPKEEALKEQVKSLEAIQAGQQRVQKLETLMDRLETRKLLRASKGHREKVGMSEDGKTPVYKWKSIRSK